jgi:hypothetical protein
VLSVLLRYRLSAPTSLRKNWKACGKDIKRSRPVELSLSYGRRSVDQFVLVSGSPLGPMTRCYPYPFCSDNCFVVLPVGRHLWREDGSLTYSAISNWSGHWGPITVRCRLIWDCVPSSSPLTIRRDYSGGILTRLHTGRSRVRVRVRVTLQLTVSQSVCLGVEPNLGLLTRDNFFFFFKLQSCLIWEIKTRYRKSYIRWTRPERSPVNSEADQTENAVSFHCFVHAMPWKCVQ